MSDHLTQFLDHLHRGGEYGYWWTAQGKRSTWWRTDARATIPNGKSDHYFGVHPTDSIPPTNAKGETKPPADVRSQIRYIAAANCLFAEFDDTDLANVLSITPPASVVIRSGRPTGGYHAYWLLAEPWLLSDDNERQKARSLQAAWVRYVGSDDGAKDLARVLRIPGTHNYKYDSAPPVEFVRCDLSVTYTIAQLAAYIDTIAPDRVQPTAAAIIANNTGDGSPLDNGATPTRLLKLALAKSGGRNSTGLWLANQLRDNEYSQAEAERIMLDFQAAVASAGDHAYSEAEARKTLASSYAGKKRAPWGAQLRFVGYVRNAATLRRGKVAYSVTTEGDDLHVTARIGKAKETVTLAPDDDTAAAAAQLAHALPVTAEEVAADLAAIPAAIAANPNPATAPAPTDAETLADFADWVNLRLNQRPGRAAKQEISNTITHWLLDRDRLLCDITPPERPYLLTEDHRALPIDVESIAVHSYLTGAGMNPTEEAFAWLRADLQVTAYRDGRKTTLARWAVIDADGFLCISCGPTGFVRAAGGTLTLHANGDRGIVFAGDAVLPAWDHTTAPVDPLTLPAFQPPLVAPHEVPTYTPAAQRRLLGAWLAAVVANLRPVPIVAMIGQKGGGKSTLMRATVRMLLGATANVSELSQDPRDFWAATTNNAVVGHDNVDAAPPIWLPDALAVLATGGQRKLRRYYTTNEEVTVPITAAGMVTTRTATFARPDVAERLLPIFTGELEDNGRLAESELERDAILARNGCLVFLARQAAALIERRVSAPKGLPARFLDFAEMAWAWHSVNDIEIEIRPTLTAWRAAQFLSIGDADPLLGAILEYCPAEGLHRLPPAGVVGQLNSRGADLQGLGGGKAIKRRLLELRPSLTLAGWRLDIDDVGGRTFISILPTR